MRELMQLREARIENMSPPPKIQAQIDKKLEAIAKKHLDVETLETRNSDRLDFHECGVGSIRAALRAAYKQGYADASPSGK